ncbi:DUF2804 family protein [Marinobacter koreensis]|uniref:DUF2804 family protein n=1 Tax=Marinobacter koreensis TaxID=335974 RepID=UPI0036068F2D
MTSRLINERGQVAPGILKAPVDHINYLDYDLRTVMDRRRSRFARHWRFNQFQFVSVMAPGWIFGMALVDLKLVGNGFFYLYDFESGVMLERSLLQPLARNVSLEPRPEHGNAFFRKGGRNWRSSLRPGAQCFRERTGWHPYRPGVSGRP